MNQGHDITNTVAAPCQNNLYSPLDKPVSVWVFLDWTFECSTFNIFADFSSLRMIWSLAWCMGGQGLAWSKDYVLMLIATLETPFLNIWTLIFQILALPLCSAFSISHSLTRISALRNFYLGHQKIIFSFLNAIKLNSGLRELPILSLPNFYRNLLSSETLRQLCSCANLPLVCLLILKMFLIKEAGKELRTLSIRPPPLLIPPSPRPSHGISSALIWTLMNFWLNTEHLQL